MGSMRLDKKPHVLAAIVVALACALVTLAPRTAWAISSSLNSSYTLQGDESSGQIQTSGNVTLDLDGHTLTLSGCIMIDSGTLTIKDSSTSGTGKILLNSNSAQVWVCGQNSGLVLESGTIDGSGQTTGPQMGGGV